MILHSGLLFWATLYTLVKLSKSTLVEISELTNIKNIYAIL